jgi:tRNA uridine 5-carboxymethylaminomethyl modification enzyme
LAANPVLAAAGSTAIHEPERVATLVKRPGVGLVNLLRAAGIESADAILYQSPEVELKYAGYLSREREAALRLAELETFALPANLPYRDLSALSFEAREKLARVRPETLGQAGRIPGVSPSDLQGLVLAVVRRRASALGVPRETAPSRGGKDTE